MTPPDGRDVAEAVVAKLAAQVETQTKRLADPDWRPRRTHYEQARNGLREALALIPSPQEHDQGGGDVEAHPLAAFTDWAADVLARHPEPPTPATAGEPSPSLREAYARLASFEDMLQRATYEDVVRRVYGPPRLEAQLRADLRAILALRTAPASSLEGGGAWRCFHCSFSTSDSEAARMHFGPTPSWRPFCIDGIETPLGKMREELTRTAAHAERMYRQKSAVERELQAVDPDAVRRAYAAADAAAPACKGCGTGKGVYTSYSGGFAHPVPCEYCNPEGIMPLAPHQPEGGDNGRG